MKLFAYAAILAASTSIIPAAANATVTVNLAQVGPNVVATLSGSLDTTGLTQFSGGNYLFTGIGPASATINFNGPSNNSNVTGYGLAGPSTFGPGYSHTAAASTSGDAFVADGSCGCVFVPIG